MSIWSENYALDNLLSSLQMDAVETHVKDSFTINKAKRNKTRMMIKDIVEKHYVKRSAAQTNKQ